MELPIIVLEELFGYFSRAELCRLRLLNKDWNSIIALKFHRKMSVRGWSQRDEYLSLFKKYGKLCREFQVYDLEERRDFFHRAIKDFKLVPNVGSLDLHHVKQIPGYMTKALGELKKLKHISITYGHCRCVLSDLLPVSHQLTSLFLYEVGSCFARVDPACFPNLKRLTIGKGYRDVYRLVYELDGSFPALKKMVLFSGNPEPECTIAEVDYQKQEITKLGAWDDFFNVFISVGFYDGMMKIAPGELAGNAISRVMGNQTPWDFHLWLEPGVPKIQNALLVGEIFSRNFMFESLATAESITFKLTFVESITFPRVLFKAKVVRIAISSKVPTGLLSWLSGFLPHLCFLELGHSIARHHWKGSLPLLECFCSPTDSLGPLIKIINNSPRLKKLQSSLNQSQVAQLKRKYPHILFSQYTSSIWKDSLEI